MLFNSIDFAIFLPLFFVIYWFLLNKQLKAQNAFIVIASYVFYGWWDPYFLLLIALSTLIDYLVGYAMQRTKDPKKRKLLLFTSIASNLGILGFFKYFDFFVSNFAQAFTFFGSELKVAPLELILPVGISFYTFQTLSYSIDVYKKKMNAAKDLISFAAFVSFFPQLVAGPIERASNLLPQFYKKRIFDYPLAVDGLRQMLWGLFKKVVIADNCAVLVNDIFSNSETYNGATLLLGAILFSFQIYGDFSGYSDIAIGVSKLFGFRLMSNFAYPYFSRDIAEFWRRWHISLSTWFKDYVYIPLGGSHGKLSKKIRNTLIIFVLSGFWHGANWTFIVWGALNALYFFPLLLLNKNRKNVSIVAQNNLLPSGRELLQMLGTFALVMLAWVFFRAENLSHATSYLQKIFSSSLLQSPNLATLGKAIQALGFIALMLLVEFGARRHAHGLSIMYYVPKQWLRWLCYYLLIALIYFAGNFSEEIEFIYFQF